MKIFFISLLLSFISVVGFSQNQVSVDTCMLDIPQVITMDCQYGKDFQFQPKCNCSITTIEFGIYNRWGAPVFESKDINEVWDASNAREGTYLWMATGQYSNGTEIDLKGQVYLIK